MIEDIGLVLSAVMQLFKLEFTLYGFTFSWWEVFVFSIVAGIIGWILWEVFCGK